MASFAGYSAPRVHQENDIYTSPNGTSPNNFPLANVIRPESGATLSGALESRTDQPKDFIRRGGRPWDRAAPRGALASSWRGWPQP
jgi:hypothetical protein